MKPIRQQLPALTKARAWWAALVAAALVWTSPSTRAQALPSNLEFQAYKLATDKHDNNTAETRLAYTNLVVATGAPGKVRVHFSSFNLGRHSYLLLTSVQDGGRQKLNAATLKNWRHTSAIFNGDKVKLELHVAPGEQGVFAEMDQLVLECNCPDQPRRAAGSESAETLCGGDSRVASTDNRVGRISGCTAWLVSNGAVLSAGHCGPISGVFEVNVPASSASGVTVASAPEDQYPVDLSNRTSIDNGKGDDYSVFALLPNTVNGDRAHRTHGFFRMSKEAPAASATIRITGFGVDNTPPGPVANCCARDSGGACTHPNCNAQSRTLQTATGTYVGETVTTPTDIFHSYQTDTEPANSGSPVIWNANGFTIGIHTHGGCAGGGDNDGTSFENTNLENLLQGFLGANTEYVDTATYPNAPAENGNIFSPWNTVTEAVAAVASGGRIAMVEGSYTAAAGNTMTMGADGKSFTLLAPVGTVTIGN